MASGAPPTEASSEEAPTDEEPPPPMGKVPALAGIAAAAALVELVGARFVLRVESAREYASLSHQQLLDYDTWGALARNLTAVSALIALCFSLGDWIRPRPFLSMSLRVGIAAVAGVLLPTLVLSTLLPVERTTVVVVLVAVGSAHVLTVLFGVGSLPWRAPRIPRMAVTGIVGASFFAFTATVVLVIGAQTLWQHAHPLGMALRRTGEVSFLVTVPLLALSGVPWTDGWRRLGLLVGLFIAGSATLTIAHGATVVGAEAWGDVLYGATHFELLLEGPRFAYVAWLGLTIFAGVSALFAKSPRDQQKGLAAILLMAGGFAPTTPGTIIPMILGASLACRTLVAHAATMPAEAPRPSDR